MISCVRTVQPTLEPVTLDQVKAHARVWDDADDLTLVGMIQAAREYAEKRLGRAILQQTWRLSRSSFPGMSPLGFPAAFSGSGYGFCGGTGAGYWDWYRHRALLLPYPHLLSVTSVTYLDPGTGERVTLDPSLYAVDADAEPAALVPAPNCWWPAVLPGRPDAVQVTYTAGYGAAQSDVPMSVQLAICGLVAHWYENREAVVLTNSTNAVTNVPLFVDSLLDSAAAPVVFDFEAHR